METGTEKQLKLCAQVRKATPWAPGHECVIEFARETIKGGKYPTSGNLKRFVEYTEQLEAALKTLLGLQTSHKTRRLIENALNRKPFNTAGEDSE